MFTYSTFSGTIRPDLITTNQQTWQHIAQSGAWWTGEQRVKIAAESRQAATCTLCQKRKAALSPNMVQGTHDHVSDLPEPVIDIIHRITTDSGRLTPTWYETKVRPHLTDGQYVELLGVIVAVICIDTLHEGIGIPLELLPTPQTGDITQAQAEKTDDIGAWVPVSTRFRMSPHIIRGLSLIPAESDIAHAQEEVYYLPQTTILNPLKPSGRAISRPQIEFIAARTSAINECFY